MTAVAIYTRLSLDPTGGAQTATARQEAASRSYADERGWTVGAVFTDVDVSAYRKGVVRPGFEALINAVDAGDVDGVLVWKLDRLVRRPADFERFWLVCENSNRFLASVTEPIDSSTQLGVAMVRILVTFGGLESATKSLRLQAKFADMAKRGEPPLGPIPFGYTSGWEVVPAEADAIRDAARRLLEGESVRALARDWNERGIQSRGVATGWTPTALRKMLAAPRLSGQRTYRGEIVADGTWPPILDRHTGEHIRALLASRSASPVPRQAELLRGLVTCGRCGSKLVGYKHKSERGYRCPSPPAGCGRTSTRALPFELWVAHQVLWRLRLDRQRSGTPRDRSAPRWPTMSISDRRDLVRTVIGSLVLHRARGGAFSWLPDRVEVRWRPQYADLPVPATTDLGHQVTNRSRTATPVWLTMEQARERAGSISRSTLLAYVEARELYARRHNRRWYFLRDDIDHFVERRRVPAQQRR